MSIFLDIIILIVIGITIFTALKNGFVKTVLNALSFVAAAVLSIFIAPLFKNILYFNGEYSAVSTYLIVFIALWLIIRLATLLLNKVISKIPLIRTANKVAGLILGIILAFFRVFALCTCVEGILKIGKLLRIGFLSGISIEETILFEFFSKINLIKILVELIF